MLSLSDRINQIADDYMTFSGKGTEGKCLLTPQDYLMFRAQAIEELKIGLLTDSIALNSPVAPIQKTQTPQISTVPEREIPQSKAVPMEATEEIPNEQKSIPGITPIPQDKLSNNAVLAILKSVEG